jgi:hypothetical protein
VPNRTTGSALGRISRSQGPSSGALLASGDYGGCDSPVYQAPALRAAFLFDDDIVEVASRLV